MTRSLDVIIRNEISEIGFIRDALDRLGSELELPARALMQLQVALDEIVSNVVKYAWPDGGEHQVHVHIAVHASGLSLDIFDDGQPFDPCQAPELVTRPPGERPRPGGLGIHMVKKLVDDVSYARIEGRNHTKLIKNCVAEGAWERVKK